MDAPDVDVTVDAVVVGAGFAGLYLLHRLRQQGFSATAFDEADDVGGTWYWNRYPGARCDIPTTDYTFGFDPELEKAWTWSEKYATQPEILDYLRFVADRYDLRRDIRFSTRLESATWDDTGKVWHVRTDPGEPLTCRHLVMATGCLSVPKTHDIPGQDTFGGDTYVTGRWPHERVDFTGKKVAVIGTGSSGIQSIPLIAKEAAELTVFQRTPNFSVPAHNGPAPADRVALLAADRDTYRESGKYSRGGVPRELTDVMGVTAPPEVRRERFEQAWKEGELFSILGVFADQGVNLESNAIVAEMIREKIRERVNDPATADALCPTSHPFGTKRPCLDTGYFETYNLPHVRLVDLRSHPITAITETGIETADDSFAVDAIVYATGFDAMTGALVSVDITGRGGVSLRDAWADGPSTYLGLMTAGFPNLFMITGPGSPSVLSNMAVSIEQHAEWVTDCLTDLRADGFETIEPTPVAQAGWDQHAADCAALTLHPNADSWYMGANVPGKPRVLYPYIGGVDTYRRACEDVAAQGYLGLRRTGPGGTKVNDGVVRRVQPDVMMVLEAMAELNLPPLHTMPVPDARGFMDAMAAQSPPGPEVGQIVDGTLPGAAGPLAYRLYRPATGGPHPVVVYFHGGGWVLGSATSDDPLCRDLCVRSDAIIVSVDYRHAPETRFPAAPDDALAAVRWLGDHVEELGGTSGPLVLAGWSAGGNLAAVTCQRVRDEGGPQLAGQLLLCPVTDSDFSRPSYTENAEGYALETATMQWFWDHYADPADRTDPKAAPIRGNLAGLPPAVVITCEFDPLRDEGTAYADALNEAGVSARHIRARGHVHTSLTQVDLVLSGAPVREEIAAGLRSLLPTPVPA
ncbi:MAG TPA: alpha/beta hydrolase fold domain-containing protein [Mycobacteriales bacterium]